jgi:hypothetical protein
MEIRWLTLATYTEFTTVSDGTAVVSTSACDPGASIGPIAVDVSERYAPAGFDASGRPEGGAFQSRGAFRSSIGVRSLGVSSSENVRVRLIQAKVRDVKVSHAVAWAGHLQPRHPLSIYPLALSAGNMRYSRHLVLVRRR